MSLNGESTIFSFASWVIYVLIGCRHPFIIYWQLLLAKTPATCSLPHPDNERQRSINSFSCGIVGNQGIALIFAFRKALLTTLIGKKYNLSKVKHQFQINWYCKLQSMQKHIVGCWKCDFHKILLTYSKNKSLNWISGWTRWETHWEPAQFRRVTSLPSKRIWVDSSGLLPTRTANLATVQVAPGPGPKVTVRNHC